jgi:3-(3-hydroxy-phenyl)propionate hydroxylase
MTDADLIVAGAGPVGLATALAAHSLGVRTVVLEAVAEEQRDPGSRALFVHKDSLRLLERATPGLGQRIGGFGVVWRRRRTLYRGRRVYDREYPQASRSGLPPFTSLRQRDTERFLREACAEAGISVLWSCAVGEVVPGPGGVEVHAADGRTFRAAYLIGADGGRSAVRRAIGIDLDGVRSTAHHVVVDLADDPDRPGPAERVFHYHNPLMSGRHVLVVPFAGGRQVDVQCATGENPEALARPDFVRSWLPAVVDAQCADRVLSVSHYPFHQRVAERFVDESRRVLLVGDAAHLFAPFGARGMNSGIADADAAAIAVATALRSNGVHRACGAVDDYDRDRRAAALRNRAAAAAALAHMRPHKPWQRIPQELAARLSIVVPRCGEWLEQRPYGPRMQVVAGRY